MSLKKIFQSSLFLPPHSIVGHSVFSVIGACVIFLGLSLTPELHSFPGQLACCPLNGSILWNPPSCRLFLWLQGLFSLSPFLPGLDAGAFFFSFF